MSEFRCPHLPPNLPEPTVSTTGCQACLEAGRNDWVHLRYCFACGRVGCCNDSPGKHATEHFHDTGHPVVRSFEPGENWFWCYVDDKGFHIAGAPAAAAYSD
jgi:uncharacterized UBP type Zn finger protein